jgi:hypothetical protein
MFIAINYWKKITIRTSNESYRERGSVYNQAIALTLLRLWIYFSIIKATLSHLTAH